MDDDKHRFLLENHMRSAPASVKGNRYVQRPKERRKKPGQKFFNWAQHFIVVNKWKFG